VLCCAVLFPNYLRLKIYTIPDCATWALSSGDFDAQDPESDKVFQRP
jgi:hypothetical protein